MKHDDAAFDRVVRDGWAALVEIVAGIDDMRAAEKPARRTIRGRSCIVNSLGVPGPGDERVELDESDVSRIGKIRWYGSNALVMYVLERRVGAGHSALVFFRLQDQDPGTAAWLKKIGKRINAFSASRSPGYCITWG